MSIVGSVLGRFSFIELSTADEKHYTLKNNIVSKLALKFIGLPHLGFRGRARIIIRKARKWVSQETRALDAGCGYGLYSLALAESGCGQIDSVDVNPERISALERMKRDRPDLMKNISLQCGSITNLPFADRTFDLIICSEVIEHIKDDTKAASELLRVIKPGGILIVSTPYNSSYNSGIYHGFGHERPGYTKDEMIRLFGGNTSVTPIFDRYYEYWLGTRLFNLFNRIKSKTLMGMLFYPFYLPYVIDSILKVGEPNGIVMVFERSK